MHQKALQSTFIVCSFGTAELSGSSLSAPRQVRAAEADAPGGEEEGGGETARPGGGDEHLQQEEGGGRDVLLISAPQERQGQEKVSRSNISYHSQSSSLSVAGSRSLLASSNT